MRIMPFAALVILAWIIPIGAPHAEPLGAVVTPPPTSSQPPGAVATPPPASLQHSIMKGATYKAGTIVTNLLFLRPATGSWLDASILTASFTGVAIVIYVANDYWWDTYYPSKTILNKDKFDVSDSAKHVTLKMITYKTAVTLATSGMLYFWTSSLPITLIVGGGLAIAKVGVFAINDMAWAWYDWHKASSTSH